ncbi:interferon-induced very large GTPase 1-like isoform X2 [Stegostoma tigrinum]|nr:interferon-induced very large GTPase 1-like isoform X2 [Stegostoma tigrinum]XP_048402085.2 interferon-induced very large GTPase 1-like isoform X2 [Stegostoma tigrinum]XP_059506732.1 interferon-induced very large GTPase 1-like isoform X2 [Stegostoma tigrinum]
MAATSRAGNWSETQLLEKASGGLALKGIFVSRDVNDLLKVRERLLEIPKTCCLLGPSMSPTEHTESFTSLTHAINSKKCVEQLGLGIRNKIETKFCSFEVDVKGEHSTSSSSSNSTKHTYVSLCKMVVVPMASAELKCKDLTLSKTAINCLKGVEKNLLYQESEHVKYTSCEQFLEQFGSHVNSSNIHFGGIYLIEAESDKLRSQEKEEAEEVMKTLINTDLQAKFGCVGASVSTSASHFKSNINSTCKKTLLDKISLSITKIGGPAEASSLVNWKKGLHNQDSTWRVIDRGSVHNLVPVWKVILQKHRGDFDNYQLLTESLQRCWEGKTGLKAEDTEIAEVMEVNTSIQDLVQEVRKWNSSSEPDFVANCCRNICQCADVKTTLGKHFSIDTVKLWYREFICESAIQEFFSKVLKCIAENRIGGVDKAYLKVQLSNLLQPQEIINSLDFPNISFVLQQLTDIPSNEKELTLSSFEEVKEYIKKLDKTLLVPDVGNEFQRKVCNELGKSLSNLQQSKDQNTSLLLTALLHPISYQPSGILTPPLTENDCEYLTSQLDQIETFRHEMETLQKTQCQAYLLHKALTARVPESEDKDPKIVLKIMFAEMGQEISQEVRETVMAPSGIFLSDTELLKEGLQHLIVNKNGQEKNIALEHSETLERFTFSDVGEKNIKLSDSSGKRTEQASRPHNEQPPQIVNDLGLQNYYPHKLSLNFIRQISHDKLRGSTPTELKDVPWHFLHKILSANSIARNLELPHTQQSESKADDEETFSDFFSVKETEILEINPQDIITAIFLCADYSLQQELMLKMSLCQFALPFLQPRRDRFSTEKRDCTDEPDGTLLLWAMRSIVKKWCPQTCIQSNSFVQESIVTAAVPTISFIRVGRCSISKSKILNLTLSQTQQQQNIFLHSEMDGGHIPRGISDGLAEISWYLPSGKKNLDIFHEAAAFINLRGDAEIYQKNTRFLAKVSAAVFVFIDLIGEKEKTFLTSLAQSPAKFFLVINSHSNQQKITTEQIKELFIDLQLKPQQCIVRKNLNDAKLVENLCSKIKQIILTPNEDKTFRNLEQMAEIAGESGIQIDEHDPKILQAKQLASKILEGLNPDTIIEYKQKVLPFHLKPWQDWSKAEKEKSRMKLRKNKTTGVYKYELDQKQKKIKEHLIKQSLSKEMLQFIEVLTTTCAEVRALFLQWLKFNLDSKSREVMSKLCSLYKRLLKDSKRTDELKDLDQKMSDSSLGVEHFMRELGQVYEISVTASNIRSERKMNRDALQLPSVAAELLLEGFPLELVDGDVSNIPVQWVTAVLKEVAEKVGCASRVCVVTVIGVQSTGKSTLLNMMFGLQFAVSSGRCTRGAYMQFLKVTGQLKNNLGCDFILVIDTEGLKAPELATLTNSYEHDNELATFVIGLSNLTLVNIGMENPTEVKDVLQIVVHSLIRMKLTGKRPGCQFIHQNVGDVCAYDQNLRSRHKLLEQLNQMVEAAAKLEKVDQIKFSDVMDYDADHSNWYIPSLWHGTPPMAAVNTGYSERIFELKRHIIQCLVKYGRSERALTIPDFIKWMPGLWEQVKNENFIFSFQNSLVAEAYSELSKKYKAWEWELRVFAHSHTNEVENKVKNDEGDLTQLFPNLERNIRTEINTRMHNIHDNLNRHFESGADNVQLMEGYREQFKQSISMFCGQIQDNLIQKCKDAINRQVGLSKVNAIWKEFHNKIEEEVQKLLQNCKELQNVLSDQELTSAFQTMWHNTLFELNYQPCSERNIEVEIENLLREDVKTQGRVINESMKEKRLSEHGIQNFKIMEKHFNVSTVKWLKSFFTSDQSPLKHATQMCNALEIECQEQINDIAKMDIDYDNKYCIDLLDNIDQKINDKTSESKFTMSEIFRAEFKLHMCGYATRKFMEMQRKFINKHDPRRRLESRKHHYFQLFLEIYKQQDQNQQQAERFAKNCFMPAVRHAMFESLGLKITNDMKKNDPEGKYTLRNNFTVALLVYLKQKGSFEEYYQYISNLENFASNWLHKQVIAFCNVQFKEDCKLIHLAKEIINEIIQQAMNIVRDASHQNINGNVQSFLDLFVEKFKTRIAMSKDELKLVSFQIDSNAKKFAEAVLQFIPDVQNLLLDELKNWNVEAKIKELPIKPNEEILKGLFSCKKKCPFCRVFCDSETPEHQQHFSKQHRPEGLSGYRWRDSQRLAVNVCTASVGSNATFCNDDTNGAYVPFKIYKTVNEYYKSWIIQNDLGTEATSYWKKVFYTFNEQFAEKHNAKPAEIERSWDIGWDEVKKQLNKTYNTSIESL